MTNRKILALVALVLAAGVVWTATRYSRWLGRPDQAAAGEKIKLQFGAQFDNVFNHPLRAPTDDNSPALLGTFNLAVNPTTRQIVLDSLDRNPDFGRFFDSFNQEGIDNRRTIRITLRLTF